MTLSLHLFLDLIFGNFFDDHDSNVANLVNSKLRPSDLTSLVFPIQQPQYFFGSSTFLGPNLAYLRRWMAVSLGLKSAILELCGLGVARWSSGCDVSKLLQ